VASTVSVVGLVDFAHSTAADEGDDLVRTNAFACGERHGCASSVAPSRDRPPKTVRDSSCRSGHGFPGLSGAMQGCDTSHPQQWTADAADAVRNRCGGTLPMRFPRSVRWFDQAVSRELAKPQTQRARTRSLPKDSRCVDELCTILETRPPRTPRVLRRASRDIMPASQDHITTSTPRSGSLLM